MFTKRLNDFVSRIIRRSRASNAMVDSFVVPQIQVSYQGGAANCEVLAPYGMGYNPSINSLSVMYSISGNNDDRAAFFYDPVKRWKALKPGEVQLGNPEKQTYIKFLDDGSIEIIGNADINIKTESGQINLGEGGSKIARLGDTVEVQVTQGSSAGTYQGSIITAGDNTST